MPAHVADIRPGMRFGIGVDSILEEARGEAISYSGEQGGSGGQKVRATARMLESQSSLMEAMNLSVSLSARYGLASADVKMDFATQHAVNEYSITMLLKAQVENPPRSMANPRLTPEADALYRRDPNQFLSLFGDTYIDEIYSGGEFFGLFIFNTRDESSRSELKADLEVSIGSFMAGGNLHASFSSTIERHSRKAEMQIWAMMSGGSGLKNPSTLDQLVELYRGFNQAVSVSPIDYKVGLKEFRYLPLPQTDPWTSQLVRQDTIEQCGRLIIDAIGQRAKLDYILSHAEEFEAHDDAAIRGARQAVAQLITNCATRAQKCSGDLGECRVDSLAPVIVDLPRRLTTTNPLAAKWEKLLADDRARGWFSQDFLTGTSIEEVQEERGGKYKLFVRQGVPIAGIFWHPDVGPDAFAVYGGIFAAYNARGHCAGPLGFPKSDEQTLRYGSGPLHNEYDGLDRINYFQHGVLWWDAQTGVVSDVEPINPIKQTMLGGAKISDVIRLRSR